MGGACSGGGVDDRDLTEGARGAREPKARSVVLISAPGRPLVDVLIDRIAGFLTTTLGGKL